MKDQEEYQKHETHFALPFVHKYLPKSLNVILVLGTTRIIDTFGYRDTIGLGNASNRGQCLLHHQKDYPLS